MDFESLPKPAEKGSQKSLGQAFLKACGCPEGKVLGRSSQWSKLLYAVRSEKGEFSPQSGGLWGKEGKPCKRGLPLNAFPIRQLFLFRQYFGFRCAEQCEQERFFSCEKVCFSVYSANEGLCPFNPHKPLKRLDLNFLGFPFRQVLGDFRKKRKTGTEILRTGQKTVCFYYFLKR